MIVRGDALRLPFADRSFDLVMGSPPYVDARLYLEDGEDPGIARDARRWVDWMLEVTAEALRVSRGLVLWVVAGKTEDRCYQPAPEGLLWQWWARGGDCHCLRPVYWHRVGIPGSGGDDWFRSDIEYVLAFKRPGKLPYANNTANGQPPKWAPGGAMSHRVSDGTRINQWGKTGEDTGTATSRDGTTTNGKPRPSHRTYTKREPNRTMREQLYAPPTLANPGNLLHTITGGGQLGSRLAHENEAPYPEELPGWFVASHCPAGGSVLDPFGGSGSTVAAALKQGRRGVSLDLRFSQCRLARRRLGGVTPGFTFTEG